MNAGCVILCFVCMYFFFMSELVNTVISLHRMDQVFPSVGVNRFGLVVRGYAAGKQKDLGSISLRFSFRLKRLWFVDQSQTVPSQLIKRGNGLHLCPSECRNHSSGDNVAIGKVSLFPRLLGSRSQPVPLPPPPGISVPTSTSWDATWLYGFPIYGL